MLCAHSSPRFNISIQSPSAPAFPPLGLYSLHPDHPRVPHSLLLQLLNTLPSVCCSLTFLPPFPATVLPMQLSVKILVVFQGPAHLITLLEALTWIVFPPHTPWWLLSSHYHLPGNSEGQVHAGTVRRTTQLWSTWPP